VSSSLQNHRENDVIPLRVLFGRLVAGRRWIFACTIISTIAFAATAFLLTPIYRSSILMVPASSDRNNLGASLNSSLGQLGGLASLAGLNVGTSDVLTEESLAVLRSRQFTELFIADENLMPKFFAKQWDPATQMWKGSPKSWPTPVQAFRYFQHNLCLVTQDKKTGLVTLQIDWKVGSEAAEWANKLVARLNVEMRTRAKANADASIGFLEKEMASTTAVETRLAVSRLMEAAVKQKMLADVTQEYAFRVIDKAMAAGRDEPIRPKKLLLLVAGPFVGLVLGIGMVLGIGALKAMW
jgi:uncharacterized protein involved in exopolysaccharide biosynthesis